MQEHTLAKIKRLNDELEESTGFDKFKELQDAIWKYVDVATTEIKRVKEGRENWRKKYMELKQK